VRRAARLAAAGLAWLAMLGRPSGASALPAAWDVAALFHPADTAARAMGPLLDPAPASPLPGTGSTAPPVLEPIPGLPELGYDLERLQADFDIPIEVNDRVLVQLREYQSPGSRRGLLRWIANAHRYGERYRAILQEHGVPGDLVYLAMIESGLSTHAVSSAGAVGPWQLIAATGKQFGLRRDRWVDERRDPEKSARAAARFLRHLHERMGDWHLAWAAYNAGPERVARALRRGHAGFWVMERGVLPGETRAYVAKIIAAAILSRHPEAFGIRVDPLEPAPWVEYALVVIPRSTSLARLGRAAGVSARELRELNPELLTGATPPRPYLLKIPVASLGAFAENGARSWSRTASVRAPGAGARGPTGGRGR
jgi:membrane-bound lytic murein transglycosylase D